MNNVCARRIYDDHSFTGNLTPAVPGCRGSNGCRDLSCPGASVRSNPEPRQGALKESASAKIAVQTLRRDVNVLLGPGGNIAVLSGPDGKLVVDAESVTARPNVFAALASINADPIKQLINAHWHFDHPAATLGCMNRGPAFQRCRNPPAHTPVAASTATFARRK